MPWLGLTSVACLFSWGALGDYGMLGVISIGLVAMLILGALAAFFGAAFALFGIGYRTLNPITPDNGD